jgi:two-component system LytT family response regulator
MSDGAQSQMIEPVSYNRNILSGGKPLSIVAAGLAALVAITVFQDFVHSSLNSYSFYLSESLLFKAFWILFLPLIFFQFRFLSSRKTETFSTAIAAVLLPLTFHLLMFPLIVWGISAMFFAHTYSYQQILTYTLAEEFYKLPIVYVLTFAAAKYFRTTHAPEAKNLRLNVYSNSTSNGENTESSQLKPLEKIVVSSGRNYIPLAVSDIFYFSAATPYIEIHLADKRYLHQETLKAISAKLSQKQFVRIHKSIVVNVEKVVSYKSRLNGDYDLLLENKVEIRLSRNYAREFKTLFTARSQVRQ